MVATIADLLASSAQVRSSGKGQHGHYSTGYTLGNKKFGNIYYNNKVVYYNKSYNILEIRMVMGTDTETQYSGYHAVRMAIYNAKGRVYDSLDDLFNEKVRLSNTSRRDLDSIEKKQQFKEKEIDRLHRAVEGSTKGTYTEGNSRRKFIDMDADVVDDRYGELANHVNGSIIPCVANGYAKLGDNYMSDGSIFLLEEPINLDSLVAVSCSCSDYFYTFAEFNHKETCHLGALPAMGGSGSLVRNLDGNIGLCKHLTMFVMLLVTGGIINPIQSPESPFGKGEGKGYNYDYKSNRKAIMNREEKLVIPKRLVDERSMRTIYNKVTKNLKEPMRHRNEQAGYFSNYAPEFDDWAKKKRQSNIKQGKGVNTGISYGKRYATEIDRLIAPMRGLYNNDDSRMDSQTYKDYQRKYDITKKKGRGI